MVAMPRLACGFGVAIFSYTCGPGVFWGLCAPAGGLAWLGLARVLAMHLNADVDILQYVVL